ncbi:MAG: hypothetical protein IK990_12310 [Ruminiclostridium sp.]|nr:hypothetical protein [Ruminiclostridium sp.]
MKKNNSIRKSGYSEEYPEYTEPKKSYTVIKVIAGIAGGAAVLAGAVFGMKFLAEHGGLKGPDVQGGAASGGNSAYTAEAAQTVERIDISELAGKTFTFSDMTATVDFAAYDGQFIRYDVTETWSGETGNSSFVLEPTRSDGFKDKSPTAGIVGVLREETDDKTKKVTFVRQYAMVTGDSFDFYPCSYSNERNIERVTDLIVTVHKERDSLISQDIPYENDELGDGTELVYLWLSPQVLNIRVGFEDYDFKTDNPVVIAVSADGTTAELEGTLVSSVVSPDKSEVVEYYYISADPQLDLSKMKAFEINGKMFEITEKPAEFTTATAITTAPLTTVTETNTAVPASDADTTAPADPLEKEIRNVSDMLDTDIGIRDAMMRDKETLSAWILATEGGLDAVKRDIEKLDEVIKADTSGEESDEHRALVQNKADLEIQQKDLESELDRLNEKLTATENAISLYEGNISELEEKLAELHKLINEG